MPANTSILALVIAGINGAAGIAVPQGGTLATEELHEIDEGDHAVTVRGHNLTDFEGITILGADGAPVGRIDEFLGDGDAQVVGVVLETRLIDPDREIELVVPLDRLHLADADRTLGSSLAAADLHRLGRWPD